MEPIRPNIVLIDDDESVRRALHRLLRSAGLDVALFATAEEFLQASEQPGPACLILDVHLPGLSGLNLYERLRSAGRHVPTIFISAYADEPAAAQALAAGAIAFLSKPFEDQVLLAAVERALG